MSRGSRVSRKTPRPYRDCSTIDTNSFVRAQPAAQFVIYVNVATQRFRWMCGNGLGERSSQKSSNEPLERWRLLKVWRAGDASRGAISLLAGGVDGVLEVLCVLGCALFTTRSRAWDSSADVKCPRSHAHVCTARYGAFIVSCCLG